MRKFFIFLPFLTLMSILVWVVLFYEKPIIRLFISADKQAQGFQKEGKLKKAIETYENKLNIGAIYFKNGEFQKALQEYEKSSSKEAFYNRGNAFVMLGKYNEAIENYKLALKVDSSHKEAEENLAIAKERQAELDKHKNTSAGTTKLGADKIVYDNKSKKGDDFEVEDVVSYNGEQQWLDRLETSPSAFLKSKFSYQYEMQKKDKR